jgi:hypothetical protein
MINKPKPLQAWLGAANYLRKYINDYAYVVKPLGAFNGKMVLLMVKQ